MSEHAISDELSPELEAFQHKIEGLVGTILLVGVLGSCALLLSGMVWRFAESRSFVFDYELNKMNLFQFLVKELKLTIEGRFRARLLISLGIVTLLLTPYIRVLASMVYFAFVEKNLKYTLFTAFVLTVLSYTLFLR